MAIVLEIVRSRARLAQLEPALWALFAVDGSATAFQSPAWILAWLECVAPDAELHAVVGFEGERVVGFVPMVLAEGSTGRVLRLAGHGESDYLGGLSAPDVTGAWLRQLGSYFSEPSSSGYLATELTDLPRGSALLELASLLGAGPRPGETCPVVELAGTLAAQIAAFPRWLRRNLGQSERRLHAAGSLEWATASLDSIDPLLEAFFSLHTARWQHRGGAGVMHRAEIQRFHRKMARGLLERGLLELIGLGFRGRIVAVAYVLLRRTTGLYLTGIDPDFERVSLGSLLILKTMERAIQRGHTQFDFMRGQESYKYDFGAKDALTYRVELAPQRLRERAISSGVAL